MASAKASSASETSPFWSIGVATAFLFDSGHEFPLPGGGYSFFCVESAQSQAHHVQLGGLAQYLCAGTRLCLRRTPRKNVGKTALLVARQPCPNHIPDLLATDFQRCGPRYRREE